MVEDIEIVKANVTRYRALLASRDLDDAERSSIKRLLAQSLEKLAEQQPVAKN